MFPKTVRIINIICLNILMLVASSNLYSQDFDLNSLQSVNVDELTDQQIIRIGEEIRNRGYTIQQLEIIARTRGVSLLQISKLKNRLQQINYSESPNEFPNTNRGRSIQNLQPQIDKSTDLFESGSKQRLDSERSEIFGMDFFTNPNLSFQPVANIPTPKGYLLGPGDQLIIDIWGVSEQTYQITVSPEGKINIPNLGPIYLFGKTIENATGIIKKRLKKIYAGLGENTFAEVSLGEIRSIQVNIIGEVRSPGTYQVSSFSSVLNALYLAGGPSENGTLRTIKLNRSGKLVEAIDIYKFILGEEGHGPKLQDGDLIIVPSYFGRIYMQGKIKRPGIYETKEGETLDVMLTMAGGFSDDAYRNSITIKRYGNLNRSIFSITQPQFSTFQVKGGDEVFVSELVSDFQNRVQIEGSINLPGEYELSDGLTLSGLIEKAQGLRGDAFLKRALVIRKAPDFSLSTIPVNLENVMNKTEDLKLEFEDIVKIQSQFDLKESYTLSIQGAVNEPGEFPYLEDLTVEGLIFLANGFKESAAKSFVEVSRRIDSNDQAQSSKSSEVFNFQISSDLSLKDEASEFILKPFDLVVVRKSPTYNLQEIVEVEGEVHFPGKYSLEKRDEKISDVLKRAGGITNFAYINGATLIRRTEYYLDSEEDIRAAKLRRENLSRLSKKDTTLAESDFEIKQMESIGIELQEILKNPGSKYDLILKEGDIISIPKQLETVRLRGEVLYPANIRYDKGLSFKSYISKAGGFTENAKKSKSYVIFANGSAERTKRFLWFNNFPDIEPGAEVIIPRKPERRKMGPAELLGITSGIASLSLVILQLVNITQ